MFRLAARATGSTRSRSPLDPDDAARLRARSTTALRGADPNLAFFALPNNPTGTLWPPEKVADAGRAPPRHPVRLRRGLPPVRRPHAAARLSDAAQPGRAADAVQDRAGRPAGRVSDRAAGPSSPSSRRCGALQPRRAQPARRGVAAAPPARLDERASPTTCSSSASAWRRRSQAFPELKVFPSEANLLLDPPRQGRRRPATRVWKALQARGILIRNFDRPGPLSGCVRITPGTPAENALLLAELPDVLALGSSAGGGLIDEETERQAQACGGDRPRRDRTTPARESALRRCRHQGELSGDVARRARLLPRHPRATRHQRLRRVRRRRLRDHADQGDRVQLELRSEQDRLQQGRRQELRPAHARVGRSARARTRAMSAACASSPTTRPRAPSCRPSSPTIAPTATSWSAASSRTTSGARDPLPGHRRPQGRTERDLVVGVPDAAARAVPRVLEGALRRHGRARPVVGQGRAARSRTCSPRRSWRDLAEVGDGAVLLDHERPIVDGDAAAAVVEAAQREGEGGVAQVVHDLEQPAGVGADRRRRRAGPRARTPAGTASRRDGRRCSRGWWRRGPWCRRASCWRCRGSCEGPHAPAHARPVAAACDVCPRPITGRVGRASSGVPALVRWGLGRAHATPERAVSGHRSRAVRGL